MMMDQEMQLRFLIHQKLSLLQEWIMTIYFRAIAVIIQKRTFLLQISPRSLWLILVGNCIPLMQCNTNRRQRQLLILRMPQNQTILSVLTTKDLKLKQQCVLPCRHYKELYQTCHLAHFCSRIPPHHTQYCFLLSHKLASGGLFKTSTK